MCKQQFLEYFSVESCKSCASKVKSEKCNDFDECSRMELDYFEKGFNSAKKEYEEKHRWIPVEEKLPKYCGEPFYILVKINDPVLVYIKEHSDIYDIYDCFTHWRYIL